MKKYFINFTILCFGIISFLNCMDESHTMHVEKGGRRKPRSVSVRAEPATPVQQLEMKCIALETSQKDMKKQLEFLKQEVKELQDRVKELEHGEGLSTSF